MTTNNFSDFENETTNNVANLHLEDDTDMESIVLPSRLKRPSMVISESDDDDETLGGTSMKTNVTSTLGGAVVRKPTKNKVSRKRKATAVVPTANKKKAVPTRLVAAEESDDDLVMESDATGDNDGDEDASGDNNGEEDASGDNNGEEDASGDNNGEEDATDDDGDEEPFEEEEKGDKVFISTDQEYDEADKLDWSAMFREEVDDHLKNARFQQQHAIELFEAHPDANWLFNHATGSGKSLLFCYLLQKHLPVNSIGVVLAPNILLCKQITDKLKSMKGLTV